MSCSQCRPAGVFPSEGTFHIRTDHPVLLQSLQQCLASHGFNVNVNLEIVSADYNNLSSLQSLFEELKKEFNKQALHSFFCSLESASVESNPFKTWIPFSHLYERIAHPELYQVIQEQLFTTYSQPIIHLAANEIYGYEFLLRPLEDGHDFKPYELFQMAERAGLQALLDGKARITSIQNSADAVPRGVKRFINFLPSSIYDPKHCLATTFKAAAEAGVDSQDLVFEVVETEEIADIDHLKSILTAYQEQGMKVALDDLGAGHSTLSVLKELRPDYVKIDRKIVSFCDEDKEKQHMIKQIVEVANEIGAIVLAEGIERKEEADMARHFGVQLAQGYYFGKPVPTEKLMISAR
ncbi:EAL domain-containing protein [Fictibacillus sp. BK138]|uniref:EAL domain-containing protein n=1 Tax=Fictibacillus sp. BK138 TaxID=2512121 RepID=UPI0010294117|nr:EAL domain-containing protein [Fictibacillus sp. BK138]RZT23334.1 EAL domain-containing protein (putative c-di-GMP-specific phosphodiesterase class I) [Fictibacillus sp. BK138]